MVHHLVEEPPDDPKALASIYPTKGRCVAILRLSVTFMTLSHAEMRTLLVHELLHLHHRDASETIRNVQTNLGDGAFGVLWDTHRDHAEIMVDQLSIAFSRLLEEVNRDEKFLTAIRKNPNGRMAVEWEEDQTPSLVPHG